MHHSRADIERPYIKRENNRRGLIQLGLTNKKTTIELKILKHHKRLDATIRQLA